jgi:ribosome modulation factor
MGAKTRVADPLNDPHVVDQRAEGAKAKRAGLSVEDCPFDEGSVPRSEWLEGFRSIRTKKGK